MNSAEIKFNIEKELYGKITESSLIGSRRLMVFIKPENLLEVVSYLLSGLNCRFITVSAVCTKNGFEIYYHFDTDENNLIINVQTLLPEENAEIDSLTNLIEAANWIEREMYELCGIKFINHPNLKKFIPEEIWNKSVNPRSSKNKRE